MSLKFKIEDIVAPEAKKAAADYLECSVCLSILGDPVQTPCQHVFCEECIAPCLACPNCNATLPSNKEEKGRSLSECNKFAHGMLQRLRVCCPYHKNAQAKNSLAGSGGSDNGPSSADNANAGAASSSGEPPAKRAKKDPELGDKSEKVIALESENEEEGLALAEFCAWEGEYGDLLSKHLAHDCLMHSIPCPKECGVILKRSELIAHEKTCKKNFEQCAICGAYVRPGDMMEHREQSAAAHVGILELRLKDAQEKVASSPHQLQFLWKVTRADLQNYKNRGDILTSSQFPIGVGLWTEEVWIKLYPCGSKKAAHDHSKVWICLGLGQNSVLFCDYTFRINAITPQLAFLPVDYKFSLRDKVLAGHMNVGANGANWMHRTDLEIEDLKKAESILILVEVDNVGRMIK